MVCIINTKCWLINYISFYYFYHNKLLPELTRNNNERKQMIRYIKMNGKLPR